MAHSVAHIRAHNYKLAQACKGLEESTQQTRLNHLKKLHALLSPARSLLQSREIDRYAQHFTAEFDAIILQLNGEQQNIRVSGNTTISTVVSELATRLKREPQGLQLTINCKPCESHLCLWQYGAVKAFCDEAMLLTFRTIDSYTTDINAVKIEHQFALQFEPLVGSIQRIRKGVITEILSKACMHSVISKLECDALLRQRELPIAHLCGMLAANNPCEAHSCRWCKQQGNKSGDCSFTQWMESRQQMHETATVGLLDSVKINLRKRKAEMDYSFKRAKHMRAWKSGPGVAVVSTD